MLYLVPAIPALLAIPVAIVMAAMISVRRPNLSGWRLAFWAALPGAIAASILGILLSLLVSKPPNPNYPDAGGMAMAAIMTLTPFYALFILCVGMIAVMVRRGEF